MTCGEGSSRTRTSLTELTKTRMSGPRWGDIYTRAGVETCRGDPGSPDQSRLSETVFVPLAFSRTTVAAGLPESRAGTTLTARYPALAATAFWTAELRLFFAFAMA